MNHSQKVTRSAQIVASFPPPMVGQAIVTARIAEELQQRGAVAKFDWLPNSKYGALQKARKLALSLMAPFWVLWHRVRGRRAFYTVANAGFGMVYNILAVATARLAGCRCFVHHHATSYLIRPTWCMRILDRLMASDDQHIVLGTEMKQMLKTNYATPKTIRVVTNGFIVDATDDEPQSTSETVDSRHTHDTDSVEASLVVGHLSNLCFEKGVDQVIETFRKLRSVVPNAKLVLAGPCFSRDTEQLVSRTQAEIGDELEYRGAVYGPEKESFFRDIDVMLYPTRDDAQPLVLLESLTHGVPAIATAVGCIPSLLDTPEWVVSDMGAFVSHAVELLQAWKNDRQKYLSASNHARHVAERCCVKSKQQLEQLCRTILGSAA